MDAKMLAYAGCPDGIREVPEQAVLVRKAVRLICKSLAGGTTLEQALLDAQSLLEAGCRSEMYSFSWMKDTKQRDLLQVLQRDFREILDGCQEILGACIPCVLQDMPTPDGVLTHSVDLLLRRQDDGVVAVNIFAKKGDRSEAGRGLRTSADAEPCALCTKAFLEKSHPGVHVLNVYLYHPDDTFGFVAPGMFRGSKKGAQLFELSYDAFMENGSFNMDAFLDYVRSSVVENKKPDCFLCGKSYLCNGFARVLEPCYDDTEDDVEETTSGEKPWKLPDFTESQLAAVRHGDGPCLVVAGPGSGKTAVLVGRINYLITEKGVPGEFILAVTFAKEAAREIESRCASVLGGKYDMPTVCTLNSLGYRILKEHQGIVGEVKLLSDTKRLSLVDDLLENRGDVLSGFSYEMKDGRNGLLRTVLRRIDLYEANPEGFVEKYGSDEGFISLAESYLQTVRAGGFITFHQQLSLCVDFLHAHPEILACYQKMFWHVLVDEYQDINQVQYELIQLLSQGRGNLMAIGDDDQAVYGFRGGNAAFMVEMKEKYPDSVYHLSENFRSTKEIVQTAARIFEKSDTGRIQKNIIAVSGSGVKPSVVEGGNLGNASLIAVKRLLGDGFEPADIAVLSWKNASLETSYGVLQKNGVPARIEKEYLCDSPFFVLIKDVIQLHNGLDDKTLKDYFSLFGVSVPDDFTARYLRSDGNGRVRIGDADSAVSVLKHLCGLQDHMVSVPYFVKYVAGVCGYRKHPVVADILEMVQDQKITSLARLLEQMSSMIRHRDEKRASVLSGNRLILTTAHEAKGREWPCVVLLDDFGKEATPDVQRLLYVAETRAKERLIVVRCDRDSLIDVS